MNRSRRQATSSDRRVVSAGVTLSLALGSLLFASGVGVGVVSAAEADEPVNITITQTPAEDQGQCVPAATALRRSVRSDDSVFELTVTASAPPCRPIEAVAVIYAMPGNGVAWPQELVERAPFTISEAGVTVITFTKTCDPVQFDVVTGATPPVIAPWGDHHGPLLFPNDLSTSLQYWGSNCNQTTTTESTTTTPTTSTSEPVSSTSEPEVLGSTTLPAGPDAEVDGGVAVTRDPTGTEVAGITQTSPAALALTGSSSWAMAGTGAALVLAGMVSVLVARRRATA